MRRRPEIFDDKKVFGPRDDVSADKETILTLDKTLKKKLDEMKEEVTDPYLGALIDERYLLHEKLGAGGMGAVYRATHVLMDKPVAIKLISAELTHLPQVVGRFEREARSASRLSHPHCITVTDFGRTEDGTLYLVMELLDGEPLENMLNRLGCLPPPLAIDLTKQILEGLAHAHGAGIIHRDLKPANVMIVNQAEQSNFAIVFDFGIAKIATDNGADNRLTQQGMIVGTPAYISPEQALGDDADHRTDLYAVGVMLFEMLTGEVPYKGSQAMDVVTAHISSEIPTLPPRRRYPVGLYQVIERAMSKKPDDRFQTADEFLAAVRALDVNKTIYFKGKRPAKNRSIYVILTIGILVGLGAYGYRYYIRYVGLQEQKLVVTVPQPELPENPEPEPPTLKVNERQVAELLEKAEEQIKVGIPNEAVATVKEALEQSPDEPAGHLLLGHALYLSGKRPEAMLSYERALASNRDLAQDDRLTTHLEEALKWSHAGEKAAALLAQYGGDKGIELLKSRANSPLSEREERSVARKALIAINRRDMIDWVATLTADFNDFKACKKRRQIIDQMEESRDPRFLPLLKAQRPAPGKWQKAAYKCIEIPLEKAIKSLSALATDGGVE